MLPFPPFSWTSPLGSSWAARMPAPLVVVLVDVAAVLDSGVLWWEAGGPSPPDGDCGAIRACSRYRSYSSALPFVVRPRETRANFGRAAIFGLVMTLLLIGIPMTETEFVTISYWESVDAMAGGTQGHPRRVHHLERDPGFLTELPQSVQILTILATRGRCTV